ncbi:MAG: TetR family transcriptional regulator [Devosia sp.]|nr:TetR family transcriptional regulator [Devosia sp.]
MPRNGEDARQRLRHAALELFVENGFDQTTAAQIAARAGVTERTFFRHFPDKREVLFDGQNILGTALSEAIGKAPPELTPMQTLHRAFASMVEMLERNRRYSEPRQRVISSTPALQERELAKGAAITRAVAEALQRRGVEKQRANLAAQAGLAALGYALDAWFADASLPLGDYLDRAFVELQQLSSPIAPR